MSSPGDLTHHYIALEGQTIPYLLKRSQRARHVRLEIWPESGLVVIVPRRCRLDDIPLLLQQKKGWILRKLSQRQDRSRHAQTDSNTVLYLGRQFTVVVREDGAEGVTIAENCITVRLHNGNAPGVALERWYRHEAERLIGQRMPEFSRALGVACRQFRVRAARTRWGSCSRNGNLNFNWKLIMAPEPVIDYVIIHELAHLREMNHSRRFWDLVQQHCPASRAHKNWLREHQAELAREYLAEERQLPLC